MLVSKSGLRADEAQCSQSRILPALWTAPAWGRALWSAWVSHAAKGHETVPNGLCQKSAQAKQAVA